MDKRNTTIQVEGSRGNKKRGNERENKLLVRRDEGEGKRRKDKSKQKKKKRQRKNQGNELTRKSEKDEGE